VTEPLTPIYDEPVRGTYPSLAWLGLHGRDRMSTGRALKIPRPPMHHLTGLRPVAIEQDEVAWELPASPWFQTAAGPFLGGISALAADAPLGGVLFPHLEPGAYPTSSELSMSFLRPAGVASEKLVARARLIDVGRTQGLSEATVADARGRVVAHMTSRLFIKTITPVPGPPDELTLPEQPVYDTPDPWERPLPAALGPLRAGETSGIDALRRIASGESPGGPFMHLFGMRLTEAEEGSVRLVIHASEWLNSAARAIYGGFLALFVDAAMTFAVTSTIPAGGSCAALDVKVHFLRPGIADGRELECRAFVVHRGRRFAVTQAELLNPDGKPVVIASGSSMVLADRPWGSIVIADEDSPGDD